MKKIPLANPVIDEEMINAATKALKNEKFILGESVEEFEKEFARFVGAKYAVAVNSGTDALIFALRAFDVKGKEVITSPASFIATANAILYAGAKPVFADIDLDTYTIDSKEVEKNISAKTKCILPVHLYGRPADMYEITEIASEYDLNVLEDACQAHGAEFWGRKVGSMGDAAAFSFYPAKNMTVCGDGGMLTTDNEKIANFAKKLRNCGRKSQYEHDELGYTSRMTSAAAAIGRVQLKRLPVWNEKRRKVAKKYHALLEDIKEVVLPPRGEGHVFHLYVIRTDKRDELAKYLEKNNIETGIHYPIPIHLQPIYRGKYGSEGDFPNTELLSKTCLSLPMHPYLTHEEIEYVSRKIHEFFSQ